MLWSKFQWYIFHSPQYILSSDEITHVFAFAVPRVSCNGKKPFAVNDIILLIKMQINAMKATLSFIMKAFFPIVEWSRNSVNLHPLQLLPSKKPRWCPIVYWNWCAISKIPILQNCKCMESIKRFYQKMKYLPISFQWEIFPSVSRYSLVSSSLVFFFNWSLTLMNANPCKSDESRGTWRPLLVPTISIGLGLIGFLERITNNK